MVDYYNNRKKIFISGYPKSGNSWIWLLLSDILDAPMQPPVLKGGVVLEPSWGNKEKIDGGKYVIIKTHFPFCEDHPVYKTHCSDLINDIISSNVIAVYRDPRAVLVSAIHFNCLPESTDSLIKLINEKLNDESYSTTGITFYEKWIRGYYNNKYNINYITTYELMKSQLLTELINMCEAVGASVPEDKIITAIDNQSFDKLKKNHDFFFWKGEVDTWKQFFNREAGELLTKYIGNFMLEFGYIDSLDWWKHL